MAEQVFRSGIKFRMLMSLNEVKVKSILFYLSLLRYLEDTLQTNYIILDYIHANN